MAKKPVFPRMAVQIPCRVGDIVYQVRVSFEALRDMGCPDQPTEQEMISALEANRPTVERRAWERIQEGSVDGAIVLLTSGDF